MTTIALSLVFFALAVVLHLFLCRQSKVKNLKAKLFMILGLGNLALFIAVAVGCRMPLVLTASAVYVLLLPVYLVFYCSTELMSPSKKILQTVQAAGQADYEAILKALERENFIMLRLEELEQSGCISRQGERYMLTPAGQAVARGLACYQIFLGREMGG